MLYTVEVTYLDDFRTGQRIIIILKQTFITE